MLLEIADTFAHSELLTRAFRDGTAPEQLAERILALTCGTADRIVLCPDKERNEWGIYWYAQGAEEPYMVGNLSYHAASKTWGTNT